MQSPEIALIVAGAAVALILSAIAILCLRGMRSEVPDLLLRMAIWAVLLALLVVLFWMPIIWIALLFAMIEITRRHRESQQYALLWLLTVAAERSMPLAPVVEAFAREQRGSIGRRARRLAEMLGAGVPLPEALQRVGDLLPRRAQSIIRVGCDSGALALALRQAAASQDSQRPMWAAVVGRVFYLTFVLIFEFLLLVFVMLKIVPAFQKIFADFGTDLPPMTHVLIDVSVLYTGYWYLFPIPLLLILLLVYAAARYWGWTQWDLPGMRRLVRRLDSAQVLGSLAIVARQQRPLGEGIHCLAESYFRPDIRQRLRRTEADIRAGDDWGESLHRRGLIQPADLAVLQAAQRVGNLPWALREMADSTRRRLAYRVGAITQAVFPVLVILMGVSVMFVVVALFLPLVSLVNHLAALP